MQKKDINICSVSQGGKYCILRATQNVDGHWLCKYHKKEDITTKNDTIEKNKIITNANMENNNTRTNIFTKINTPNTPKKTNTSKKRNISNTPKKNNNTNNRNNNSTTTIKNNIKTRSAENIDAGTPSKNENSEKKEIQITCAICLEYVESSQDAELECEHIFHIDCVKMLHDNACPVCRKDLKSKKLCGKDINNIEKRKLNDKLEREGVLEQIPEDIINDGIFGDEHINFGGSIFGGEHINFGGGIFGGEHINIGDGIFGGEHINICGGEDIIGNFIEDVENILGGNMIGMFGNAIFVEKQYRNKYKELITELSVNPPKDYYETIEYILDIIAKLSIDIHDNIFNYKAFLKFRLFQDLIQMYPDVDIINIKESLDIMLM